MARRGGASRAFKIFAIVMVLFLMLGTVVVFGGALFGSSQDDGNNPVNEAERQKSELETQVAENPDDADAAGVLANIYANEGNIAASVPLYEKATEAHPDDGNLRLAFGIALLRGGSFLDARIQLERALDLLPNNAAPAYYLGQIEQEKDEPDLEAARDWYEQAIETAPDSLFAEQATARIDEIDAAEATATP